MRVEDPVCPVCRAARWVDRTERPSSERVVRHVLALLGRGQRQVLVELYLRGRAIDEVADTLGVPPAIVKLRLYDSLRALREQLRRHGIVGIAVT